MSDTELPTYGAGAAVYAQLVSQAYIYIASLTNNYTVHSTSDSPKGREQQHNRTAHYATELLAR